MKRTIDTFICSGEKLNTLLASLSGHFTSNMSQNVHGDMYFTSCEKVPTGAFCHEIRLNIILNEFSVNFMVIFDMLKIRTNVIV